MKWYMARLVYRIVCGNGEHTPQFDEQLRLVSAIDEETALLKSRAIGQAEQDTFFNCKQQLVCWQFVNISELYQLHELIDGAELDSRVNEVEDAEAYITFVNWKAEEIRQKQTHQMLNLM